MSKELSDFDDVECEVILDSIINNRKHINEDKTINFLKLLININKKDSEYILKHAELYYYTVKNYFNSNKDQKKFYMTKEIIEFKASAFPCCLQLLESDDVSAIIDHSLSIEHFVGKLNLDKKKISDIKTISEYFFATGNVNTKELRLIIDLIHNNKVFRRMIKEKK